MREGELAGVLSADVLGEGERAGWVRRALPFGRTRRSSTFTSAIDSRPRKGVGSVSAWSISLDERLRPVIESLRRRLDDTHQRLAEDAIVVAAEAKLVGVCRAGTGRRRELEGLLDDVVGERRALLGRRIRLETSAAAEAGWEEEQQA